MPPKVKYSREEILDAAVALTRERGFDAVTARDLGARLGTSAKPVYGAFQNMSELKEAVIGRAYQVFASYQTHELETEKYPAYKATGMAYIRFAGEEPELFRLLFMRDRSREHPGSDDGYYRNVMGILQDQTGLEGDGANLLHAEMWIFVHGIAAMVATSYMSWDTELVSRMLTDVYQGLLGKEQ